MIHSRLLGAYASAPSKSDNEEREVLAGSMFLDSQTGMRTSVLRDAVLATPRDERFAAIERETREWCPSLQCQIDNGLEPLVSKQQQQYYSARTSRSEFPVSSTGHLAVYAWGVQSVCIVIIAVDERVFLWERAATQPCGHVIHRSSH